MYDDKGVTCGVCSGRLFLIPEYRCRPLNSIVKVIFFAVKLPIKSKEIRGNTRKYKEIQGNTRKYKEIQGNTRNYNILNGIASIWKTGRKAMTI